MDVVLVNYGHCNFVSPKHASIFYDEVMHIYSIHWICKIMLHYTLLYLCKWKPLFMQSAALFSFSQVVIVSSILKLALSLIIVKMCILKVG
jgi:hypothetical protein